MHQTSLLLANAGTPLMWGQAAHLLFGNILIAMLEGALLMRWFGAPRRATVLILILANYVSMIIGYYLMNWLVMEGPQGLRARLTIETVAVALPLQWLALYVLTVVIEWPLVYWALGPGRSWAKAAYGCLAVQTVSYLLLTLFYEMLSTGWMIPRATLPVVKPADLGLPGEYAMYWVKPEDQSLWRMQLGGYAPQRVGNAPCADPTRLFLRFCGADEARPWSLELQHGYRTREPITLIEDFASTELCSVLINPDHWSKQWEFPIYWTYSAQPDLRPAEQRRWNVRFGYGLGGGLIAEDSAGSQRIYVSFQTPYLSWFAQFAFVLPGEFVILQLADQLVAVNLNERKMALLARGVGLVVVPTEFEKR